MKRSLITLATLAALGAPALAAAGSVTVKGSDTMVILAQRWAEEYMKKNAGKKVQVTGGGSGTGIAALVNGTTDIADASRAMKDDEKAKVRARPLHAPRTARMSGLAGRPHHAVKRRMDGAFFNPEPFLMPPFDGHDLQGFNQRHIQTIGPDHRFAASIFMLVPGPLRRADQVAGLHNHLLAGDIGKRAFALQDEAESGHGMAVCRRHFAGLNQLKAEEHGVRRQLAIVEAGIDQPDISAFGSARADADDIARPLQRVVDIGPFPKMRFDSGFGFGGAILVADVP